MKNKILGFILIREYPGCSRKVGYFEKYSTGDFLNYPEIWQPVYSKDYIRNEKIEKLFNN